MVHPTEYDADATTPEAFVKIVIHSHEPIHVPRLEWFIHPAGGSTAWDFDDPAEINDGWRAAAVLAPGESQMVPVRISYDPPLSAAQKFHEDVPVIAFTDAAGQRWRRFGTARPTTATDSDGSDPESVDRAGTESRRPSRRFALILAARRLGWPG